MENQENEVYSASKSHCRFGKITSKKIEEEQSTTNKAL